MAKLKVTDLTVGDRVRQLRMAAGLTISALARQISVTPTAVTHWEKHGKMPHHVTLARLCYKLKTTESYLLTGAGPLIDANPDDETIPVLQNSSGIDADPPKLSFVRRESKQFKLDMIKKNAALDIAILFGIDQNHVRVTFTLE